MIDIASTLELFLVALVVALITRRTKRPYTIALVIWGLLLGLLQILEPVHLTKEMVLALFLPPLLFEGALHIEERSLRRRAGVIFGLALGGTLVTAAIVAGAGRFFLGLDWIQALLLGVIIAPTDPVSVLATFKQSEVDPALSTIVEAESLFNDGVAVVLYVLLVGVLEGGDIEALGGLTRFLYVVGFGAVIGLGVSFVASRLLENLDDPLVEILTTLISAFGAYLIAEHFESSGVIAVGIAGLLVGNRGLKRTSRVSRQRVHNFWEVVAFLVNSAVFLLIGFELRPDYLVDNFLLSALIFMTLMGARALLIYTIGAVRDATSKDLPMAWRHVMFWGGMRGAVPVALALGLPTGMVGRADLVVIVFGVVLISLLLQGLTISGLLARLGLAHSSPAKPTWASSRQ